jgi:hypothetical protein
MLPPDNQVSPWVQAGVSRITDETAFYNRIDGAAPKYIDRGWVSTVYANYIQGTRSIQVAIHDMGSDANAESIFTYDEPSSWQSINGLPNAVLDMGLSSAYAAFAYVSHFFIEINISEKTDAARADIERFTNLILDRGT